MNILKICGTRGLSTEEWIRDHGMALQPHAKDFIRRLVSVGSQMGLSHVTVKGFRTPEKQCEAIYANWRKRYTNGGTRRAIAWAINVYGKRRGPGLHAKYLTIYNGDWTMEEYVADFKKRNANRATHSSGRAFDITPCTPQVGRALRTTMAEGLFAPAGKGIVDEGNHYHVQLSRANATVRVKFEDIDTLVINAEL